MLIYAWNSRIACSLGYSFKKMFDDLCLFREPLYSQVRRHLKDDALGIRGGDTV